jgi:hypothetical protein
VNFGGERGPGVNTRLYESIQMLYIAYSMKYPNTFILVKIILTVNLLRVS